MAKSTTQIAAEKHSGQLMEDASRTPDSAQSTEYISAIEDDDNGDKTDTRTNAKGRRRFWPFRRKGGTAKTANNNESGSSDENVRRAEYGGRVRLLI